MPASTTVSALDPKEGDMECSAHFNKNCKVSNAKHLERPSGFSVITSMTGSNALSTRDGVRFSRFVLAIKQLGVRFGRRYCCRVTKEQLDRFVDVEFNLIAHVCDSRRLDVGGLADGFRVPTCCWWWPAEKWCDLC